MIADVCLLLMLDASQSVDTAEWEIQAVATARALSSPQIVEKMTSGHHKRIAIAAVEWSGRSLMIAPWTMIANGEDARQFADKLEGHKREQSSTTYVTAALENAEKLFRSAPDCDRRVIDISSDGTDTGNDPKTVIDRLASNDIIVNAIVVYTGGAPDEPEEDPTPWYEARVSGFVKQATWTSYNEIIKAKLSLEIASAQ